MARGWKGRAGQREEAGVGEDAPAHGGQAHVFSANEVAATADSTASGAAFVQPLAWQRTRVGAASRAGVLAQLRAPANVARKSPRSTNRGRTAAAAAAALGRSPSSGMLHATNKAAALKRCHLKSGSCARPACTRDGALRGVWHPFQFSRAF